MKTGYEKVKRLKPEYNVCYHEGRRKKLLQILADNQRETRRGEHNTKRIFCSLLNLVSFVETEATARRFVQKVGKSLSVDRQQLFGFRVIG